MKTTKQITRDLRSLRGKRTIREVSTAIGVSPSALSMYESGARTPRDEIKAVLAAYYGTTVGDLFFGEEGHK